ncbi:hypothetical protein AC781_03070 [Akkermansia glycaniphila]|nr:hypothetical protein AC781_03070 [Akkermansia glycaniphila]
MPPIPIPEPTPSPSPSPNPVPAVSLMPMPVSSIGGISISGITMGPVSTETITFVITSGLPPEGRGAGFIEGRCNSDGGSGGGT